MRRRGRTVTSLALAATLVTGAALADGAPAEVAPAASASTPATGTELPLRPSKPLSLEPAPTGAGPAWKLTAFAILAAAGLWAWKKRAARVAVPGDSADLRVVKRTTIGVRSELLLVDVEGQRVLIGVTPSSMQTLYLMPDTGRDEAPEAAAPDRRIASMLESRLASRDPAPAAARAALEGRPAPDADEEDYEGQAVGLRAIGARR